MTVWYTARGAGISALVLLTLTLCLGAFTSNPGRPATRYIAQYVHRVASGLGLGVLALHIGTVLADTYAKVNATGAVVPFTAGYRATWVGLGTIAAWLLVTVTVLGLARGRLAASARGARAWRVVHVLAYPAWLLALVHGWTSGTDTHVPWVRVVYLLCGFAGVAALVSRWSQESRPRPLLRRPEARPVLKEVAR